MLWILARQSDCNTFLLSVCVRSSEPASWCAPLCLVVTSGDSGWDCLKGSCQRSAKFCIDSANMRVTQTWQPQLGLQSIACNSPHTNHILLAHYVRPCKAPFSASITFGFGAKAPFGTSLRLLAMHTVGFPTMTIRDGTRGGASLWMKT